MSVEAQIVSSNNAPKLINAWELKDGQIGIIREWDGISNHIGDVVQREGRNLINIGRPYGASWTNFFAGDFINEPRLIIEILPSNSSILLINENE